jgi:hypothetical protein
VWYARSRLQIHLSKFFEAAIDIGGISVRRTPVLGTILYDEHAIFRRVRDYRRQEIFFPPLYAYYVEAPLVTNAFIVHDERRVFVDTSIINTAAAGNDAQNTVARFCREIGEAEGSVSDEFADETALVIHNEGGGTWGHFLIQNFPKVLLYLRHHPDGKIVVPRPHMDLNSNYGRLFELYGIPLSKLLPVDRGKTYRFGEIVIVDFLHDFVLAAVHPVAVDLLNQPLLPVGMTPDIAFPETQAVFIERSADAGSRAIANWTDLQPVLARHQVASHRLGTQHVRDQVETWRSSTLIVSTLGSDLANIVFSRPGTRILSISPDWFGDNFFYNLAVAKEVQWNELRCGVLVEPSDPIHLSSFAVDDQLLDTMLATPASRI